MPRDLEHLELPRVEGEFPRRLHGGGRPPARANKLAYGRRIVRETEQVLMRHRAVDRPQGISPALLFKLKTVGNLEDDQLRSMGLSVVARDPDKTIVVFSSDEALATFKRYVREYSGLIAGGHRYAFVAAIESVLPIEPEDRIGRLLREAPLGLNEIAPLDVELWHPGDRDICDRYLGELEEVAVAFGGELSDTYRGESLLLARLKLNGEALRAFLEIEYIREIDRLPKPTFETSLLYATTLDEIGHVPDAAEDACGILVVDSGITANHPLLRPALGDAQAFPQREAREDTGGPEDSVGHGTAVSGLAVYGDIRESIEAGRFIPEVRLFSARVLDDEGEYDRDELIQNQLEHAIRYFIDNYPQCRVVNISLGDLRVFLRENERQLRLAAHIDDLAYRYREHEIVFVVSAGNYTHEGGQRDCHITEYPMYLLSDEARIIDPASAALAVTVGSLATGNTPFTHASDAGVQAVAGEVGFPSPFTRTGFGVDGMVKPELVALGGDYAFSRGTIVPDPGLGVPTTCKDFLPPGGQLFCSPAGTSFAAPSVSNVAAKLFTHFPEASSNMIRCLLADAAQIPTSRPGSLDGADQDETVMRVYGYGMTDYDRAAYSAQNDVLLLAQGDVALDSYQLYEIPPIPEDFFRTDGKREICVTLAFDPPTRATRGDSYLGVRMRYHLFRNTSLADVEALFRDWKRAPAEVGEAQLEEKLSALRASQKVDLKPGGDLRAMGTLQKGVLRLKKSNWTYDGAHIVMAVSCFRKWAGPEIERQRYAVVVSLKHSGEDVKLYDRIRQHVRVVRRVRARAR